MYTKLAKHFGVPREFLLEESENDFEIAAEAAHGPTGNDEAQKLANKILGLYAGGEISDEDAEKVMIAFQKAFWDIKEQKMKSNSD